MRQCSKCDRRFEAGETVCPHDGTILDDSMSFEEQAVGKTLDGKYRIDGFLTKGGMGSVYRGTHVMLNKPVAIKLIKPELVSSTDIVQRFLREARAAAHLSHPNIVTVHDLGQTADGMLYIAMELVDGKSLKELIVKEGAWEPRRSVRLLKGIASALGLAHREGIFHRDLKPQNIMVARDSDGVEIPKLLDFGIAKTLEPDSPALTATGMVLGTPHYMSTEQAKGLPADARSDLYALGIILYEMLIGEVPFDDISIPQILIKHLHETPKPPSSLNENVPAKLSAIVLRLMEKDPDQRFQSAEALTAALDDVADTEIAGPAAVPVPLPVDDTIASEATVGVPERDLPTSVASPTMAGGAAVAMAPPPLPVSNDTAQPTVRARDVAQHRSSENQLRAWMLLPVVLVVALLAFFLWPSDDSASDVSQASAAVADLSPSGEAALEPAPESLPEPAPESETAATTSNDEVTGETDTGGTPAGAGAPSEAPPVAVSAAAAPPPRETSEPASGTEPSRPPGGAPEGAERMAGSGAPSQPMRQEAASEPPPIPATPALAIVCDGVRDGCAALRRAVADQSRRRSISMARPPAGDVLLRLDVEEIEARQEQQFGTTFVVRTYSIEAAGDSRHFDDEIFFDPETITFDARLGREKLMEQSRLIAARLVAEIERYWAEQTRPR